MFVSTNLPVAVLVEDTHTAVSSRNRLLLDEMDSLNLLALHLKRRTRLLTLHGCSLKVQECRVKGRPYALSPNDPSGCVAEYPTKEENDLLIRTPDLAVPMEEGLQLQGRGYAGQYAPLTSSNVAQLLQLE